jgi:hypothetical protein
VKAGWSTPIRELLGGEEPAEAAPPSSTGDRIHAALGRLWEAAARGGAREAPPPEAEAVTDSLQGLGAPLPAGSVSRKVSIERQRAGFDIEMARAVEERRASLASWYLPRPDEATAALLKSETELAEARSATNEPRLAVEERSVTHRAALQAVASQEAAVEAQRSARALAFDVAARAGSAGPIQPTEEQLEIGARHLSLCRSEARASEAALAEVRAALASADRAVVEAEYVATRARLLDAAREFVRVRDTLVPLLETMRAAAHTGAAYGTGLRETRKLVRDTLRTLAEPLGCDDDVRRALRA